MAKGHLDPKLNIQPRETTATFLSNILTGNPDEVDHPAIILKYLESKNRKPSDEFAEYRAAMMEYIKGIKR